jgi:hypothetical protein
MLDHQLLQSKRLLLHRQVVLAHFLLEQEVQRHFFIGTLQRIYFEINGPSCLGAPLWKLDLVALLVGVLEKSIVEVTKQVMTLWFVGAVSECYRTEFLVELWIKGLRLEVIEHHPCFDDVKFVQIYEIELVIVGKKNQMSGFFIKLI